VMAVAAVWIPVIKWMFWSFLNQCNISGSEVISHITSGRDVLYELFSCHVDIKYSKDRDNSTRRDNLVSSDGYDSDVLE